MILASAVTHSIGFALPPFAVAIALVILGAIWGSFAAALCYRWPLGEGVMRGRSHCDHCGKTLGVHELVPLLSYAVQGGKCWSCRAGISPINPLIELLCAALGFLAALSFDGYAAIAAAMFFWLMVPLIILDWRHLWLPNALTLLLAVLGLLMGELFSQANVETRLIGGVMGYAILQGIRLAFQRLRGVEGMGGGDPKLLGAIGLWVGWQILPAIILVASVIGLLHFLGTALQKSPSATRFPFGSYLAISTITITILQSYYAYHMA